MDIATLSEWLIGVGLSEAGAKLIAVLLALIVLFTFAALANWIAKSLIMRFIRVVVDRTSTQWDDELFSQGVFTRMSHVAPAIVVQVWAPSMLESDEFLVHVANTAVSAYLLIIALLVIDAVLNTVLAILEKTRLAHRVPVKSFMQALKLVIALVGFILFLSIIFNRNPLYFFSGLGALTAVLLLVFKDSILGLVAGVQLSANNMIRKGDWIEMPKHGADGDVIDVTLTTIKVQNWDRTITSIPTYALISEAFRNWRGMSESGGRRIKRALNIDMQSVRFVDDALLAKLESIQLLRPYLDAKREEIRAWNDEHGITGDAPVNGRHLTNLGCLRAYLLEYLRRNPKIHQEMTFLVRQLPPGPTGIPIEIYVFSNDIAWANYEGIQADIFDHLIAAIPTFGLRIFQNPSGGDLAALQHAFTARAG